MSNEYPRKRRIWPLLAQLRKREPFRIWPILVAIIALSIQSVTYGLLAWFYGSFGVSPEEVGFSYSDILGRNSLQLAFATLLGFAAITLLSAAVGLFGAIGGLYWWYEQRTNKWKSSIEGKKAAVRGTVAAISGFVLLLFSLALTPQNSIFVAVLIMITCLVLIGEALWAARVGSPRHSILFRMTLLKQYYSSLRLVILLVSATIVGILIQDWLSSLLATFALLVLNTLLPRSSDFEEPVRSVVLVRVRQFYIKWLFRVLVVGCIIAAPIAAITRPDWIVDFSSLDSSRDTVISGKPIIRDPLNTNIFRLANPRADAVLVQWVGPTPPVQFTGENGTSQPKKLILFGSSSGITVLFDPSSQLVYRLPSNQLIMATAN